MSLKSEIELLKIELDKIEDLHLVEAIKNMLAYGKAKRYEKSFAPMSREDFYQRQDVSGKAIERNNLINHEEVKAYFANKHA